MWGERLRHGGAGGVRALTFVEGGGLVSGGGDRICVWAHHGALARRLLGTANGLAALPGGRFAAAGGGAGNLVEVLDAASGERVHRLAGHKGAVRCVAALPNSLLASGSADTTVRLWDAAEGRFIKLLKGHTNWVSALAALPGGQLASGSGDNTARVWDVATGGSQVLPHPGDVRALAALDDGRLASGCADHCVRIWVHADGLWFEEAKLSGHTYTVFSLAALPNGLLASGGGDSTVRVWDLHARECILIVDGFTGWAVALAPIPVDFGSNGCGIAFGVENDPSVYIFAYDTAALQRKRKDDAGGPEGAALPAPAATAATREAAPPAPGADGAAPVAPPRAASPPLQTANSATAAATASGGGTGGLPARASFLKALVWRKHAGRPGAWTRHPLAAADAAGHGAGGSGRSAGASGVYALRLPQAPFY